MKRISLTQRHYVALQCLVGIAFVALPVIKYFDLPEWSGTALVLVALAAALGLLVLGGALRLRFVIPLAAAIGIPLLLPLLQA